MARKNKKGPAPIGYFVCAHCSHSFRLRTRGGNVKCTKCMQRFLARENTASEEVKQEILARRREYKMSRTLQKHPNAAKPQEPLAIRGNQVPVIPAEAAFKSRAVSQGYTVHRPSWPDYLLEKDGKLMHVEVKSRSDEVSKEQALTFCLLERHGIPVYIWKDCSETRGELIRWGDGVEAKRIACKDKSTRINALRRHREDMERLRASK